MDSCSEEEGNEGKSEYAEILYHKLKSYCDHNGLEILTEEPNICISNLHYVT